MWRWLNSLLWAPTPLGRRDYDTQQVRRPATPAGDDEQFNEIVWATGAVTTVDFNDPPKEFTKSMERVEKTLRQPNPWNKLYDRNKP